MLDQPYMTDLIEANSMGHEPNLIDIYSASWGPTDDGETVDGPRNATMRAIVRGVNEVSWSLCVVVGWGGVGGIVCSTWLCILHKDVLACGLLSLYFGEYLLERTCFASKPFQTFPF